MQNTSALYQSIISGTYSTEVQLLIMGDDNAEHTIDHTGLVNGIEIVEGCFDQTFSVGNAVAAEISVQMLAPIGWTPARMAQMKPYFRVTNGAQTSEWLPKGVFFIDTRKRTKNAYSDDLMEIHGYDRMMMAEQDYPGVNWVTKKDWEVLEEICSYITGWSLNAETKAYIQSLTTFNVSTPYSFTIREVLQSIAAMRAGNFVMDENGELKLIPLTSAPPDTNYLINNNGNPITFGGARIVLR